MHCHELNINQISNKTFSKRSLLLSPKVALSRVDALLFVSISQMIKYRSCFSSCLIDTQRRHVLIYICCPANRAVEREKEKKTKVIR